MKRQALLIAIALLIPTFASAQDKTPSPAQKQADKTRESMRKWMAKRDAETEQRKAIVNDLINTCVKCEQLFAQYLDAKDGTQQQKSYSFQSEQCYETLWAKIDRTPLDILTPFAYVTKGTDLSETKRTAFFRLYEAYEYGTEHPKSSDPKTP